MGNTYQVFNVIEVAERDKRVVCLEENEREHLPRGCNTPLILG